MVILIGLPLRREVTDEDIEAALSALLPAVSVKDAAKTVSSNLGIARSRAYDIGLRLKDRSP